MTGPFRYITYLSEFGPESYFVNVPSKWLPASSPPTGSPFEFYLSYSANFAFHQGANPPGSGYHWTLENARFR